MASALELKSAEATITMMGAHGSALISGTDEVTAPTGYYFVGLQFMEDTVVASQTDYAVTNQIDLSTFTDIVEGTVLIGRWDAITLTSGTIYGYLARK